MRDLAIYLVSFHADEEYVGSRFFKKRLTSAWLVETLPPPPLPSHLNHLSFRFVLPSRVISSISTSHWLPTFQADTSHMSVASVHAKALIAAKAQLDATTSVGDPPTPSLPPPSPSFSLCISVSLQLAALSTPLFTRSAV